MSPASTQTFLKMKVEMLVSTPSRQLRPHISQQAFYEISLTYSVSVTSSVSMARSTSKSRGTKMAPSYTNLFMDRFKRAFLAQKPIPPLVWKPYNNDILYIWIGSKSVYKGLVKVEAMFFIFQYTCTRQYILDA